MWNKFAYFVARLKEFFSEVGGWIVVFITFLIAADVAGRYFFGLPLPSVYEFSEEILMVTCIFFALPSAPQIEITLVTSRYPPKVKRYLDLVKHALVTVFLSLVSWQAIKILIKSWVDNDTASAILPFPTYPGRATLALGCILFTIVELISIVEIAKNKRENK